MSRLCVPLVLVFLLAITSPAPPAGAGEDGPFGEDTTAVGLTDSTAPNVSVAVELSRATFDAAGADTVLIGRDDLFADSLSSGAAQADGPLLLVPMDGPVPASVRDEIERLGATSAVIFGGENAVSPAVATGLEGLGLTVRRVEGPTRIETATDAAGQLAPDATTAILARAGGVEGNPTSAFADALAAGGWAAATGWPVLLSQTEVLTESTRTYLASSSITEVKVMGGTLAISDDVVAQLAAMDITTTRVAGTDRADTAIGVAKARGAETAAGAGHLIAVDGFGEDAWAAGFASAARSAALDAPIVLGNVDSLPPATEEWLAPGPDAITCALTAAVCDAVRIAVGFTPAVPIPVPPGTVLYTVANDTSSLVWSAQFDGAGSGLAFPCADPYCTLLDFHAIGERMAVLVQRPGVDDDAVYYLFGETLRLTSSAGPSEFSDDSSGLDAGDNTNPGANSFVAHNGNFLIQDAIGGAARSSAGPGGSGQPSYQSRNLHPLMLEGNAPPARSGTLYLSGGQELIMNLPFADTLPAQVQRRGGAQVIGAAWSPTQSGDIAITDQIANTGLLRIAPWPDGEVIEVAGLDVNSAPVWTPDGSTVMVLADTDSGVSLVSVDAATGGTTVLVEDAGPASGARISTDGSGTLVAWHAGDEIRVVNTNADDEVSSLPIPEGYGLVAGPTFRP